MSTKEDLVKAMSTWLKKKEDLPLSFGADSEKVLTGEKSLLSGDDLLNFKCTGNDIQNNRNQTNHEGCGACCRSYPNSVILDSYDFYLMSRSPHIVGLASQRYPNYNSLLADDVKKNEIKEFTEHNTNIVIKPFTTTYMLREFKVT